MQIICFDHKNKKYSVTIDYPSSECPVCHRAITPLFIYAYRNEERWDKMNALEVVYRCPAIECQDLFISNFEARTSSCTSFCFKNSVPFTRKSRQFDKTISSISDTFCLIYNQALSAEQYRLLEICGVGYRKSLEFLIKDYAIKNNPNKKEEIKKKFLSECISKYIKNENIRKVAERAVWLGNDETHYLRKWKSKDLNDLKKLIDLTVHWFEMEQLTEEITKEMSPGKNK